MKEVGIGLYKPEMPTGENAPASLHNIDASPMWHVMTLRRRGGNEAFRNTLFPKLPTLSSLRLSQVSISPPSLHLSQVSISPKSSSLPTPSLCSLISLTVQKVVSESKPCKVEDESYVVSNRTSHASCVKDSPQSVLTLV